MQAVFKTERIHMFTMNKVLSKHLEPTWQRTDRIQLNHASYTRSATLLLYEFAQNCIMFFAASRCIICAISVAIICAISVAIICIAKGGRV
ncbi:hypothetical protein GQ44DRAFT_714653 [Phaeosphaeriaceae sp. PMI808]|nr:hypothetical protein GQ44DRAFT_714653 [Phaeosphaeriaceae sp. PMI808]